MHGNSVISLKISEFCHAHDTYRVYVALINGVWNFEQDRQTHQFYFKSEKAFVCYISRWRGDRVQGHLFEHSWEGAFHSLNKRGDCQGEFMLTLKLKSFYDEVLRYAV